jgi:NAD(P)-dependent dehydrogenase (short-subunit alcohol dehydrogenase family)
MTIDLSGITILVTGASRGIGRGLADGLAAAGATVAIHYHRSQARAEELAERMGHGARAFPADLASVEATEQLFDAVVEAYGTIDVLVNNAGVALSAPLDATTDDWQTAWDTTHFVNLRAAEHLSRRFIQHHRVRRERDPDAVGRIIHIASRAAFRGDTPDYLAYASSKGGMVALSRSIARGLGREGIVSFVVAPGFTRTDMAQDFIDAYGEDYAVRDTALGQMAEPQDMAPIVVLLASGQADHATGATIDVNSGSYVH